MPEDQSNSKVLWTLTKNIFNKPICYNKRSIGENADPAKGPSLTQNNEINKIAFGKPIQLTDSKATMPENSDVFVVNEEKHAIKNKVFIPQWTPASSLSGERENKELMGENQINVDEVLNAARIRAEANKAEDKGASVFAQQNACTVCKLLQVIQNVKGLAL